MCRPSREPQQCRKRGPRRGTQITIPRFPAPEDEPDRQAPRSPQTGPKNPQGYLHEYPREPPRKTSNAHILLPSPSVQNLSEGVTNKTPRLVQMPPRRLPPHPSPHPARRNVLVNSPLLGGRRNDVSLLNKVDAFCSAVESPSPLSNSPPST